MSLPTVFIKETIVVIAGGNEGATCCPIKVSSSMELDPKMIHFRLKSKFPMNEYMVHKKVGRVY